jgi:transposase
MTIHTLGIDIAKNVFQLHGVSQTGAVALKRRVMRDSLMQAIAQIAPCTIAIEACTGAFHWQRRFESMGTWSRSSARNT